MIITNKVLAACDGLFSAIWQMCRPAWVLSILDTGGVSQLIRENSHMCLNGLYLLLCSEFSVCGFSRVFASSVA
jgi:hypothetical protein